LLLHNHFWQILKLVFFYFQTYSSSWFIILFETLVSYFLFLFFSFYTILVYNFFLVFAIELQNYFFCGIILSLLKGGDFMKIINLEKQKFDVFAKNHMYRNFYQTSAYGDLMESCGFESHYLGFTNNSDQLVGATLILYRKAFFHYKYAYCPSGFLIDYTNLDFVQELTEKLRKFLYQNHFIFLRIDPPIHCSERDASGAIISYNPEINTILNVLQTCGYQHKGFNLFFENTKARFNAVVKLHTTNDKLLKSFHKQTRNKIHKANKSGIVVYKASASELPIFYEFVKRKHHRNLKYYQQLFDCFGDRAELYLAKIDPHKYVAKTKDAYEAALSKSDLFTEKIQDKNTKGKDLRKIINRKMEADKVLAQEQGNLTRSTRLFQEKPDGVIVGGAIVMKGSQEVFLLIEGFHQKYRSFNPNYYLKWELIKKFNQEGYQYFNLNAIVGEFQKPTKYSGLNEMKLGFAATAIEYIGDFDYVIHPLAYRFYLKKQLKRKTKN